MTSTHSQYRKMSEFSVTTGRDGSRRFGEHDDRWVRGGGDRDRNNDRGRNNYNNNRGRGGRGKYRGGNTSYYRGGGFNSYSRRGGSRGGRSRGGPHPRSRVDDEGDDLMGDDDNQAGSKQRFSPYGRPSNRGNYRNNYRGGGNRYNDSGDYNSTTGSNAAALQRLGLPLDSKDSDADQWYKVHIPYGKKADKDFIIQNINNNTNTPFVPTNFHYELNSAVFFVQGYTLSEDIRRVNKRVTLPTGYKMTIIVKKSVPPAVPIGAEELQKIKIAMSGRYDPATKALNLSDLEHDQELQRHRVYMALYRPQVMTSIAKIIEENIPELVSLDLSNNRLSHLEHLSGLVAKTPNIVHLDISRNKINHMDEFQKLRGWKIEALNLQGNFLCDKFRDKSLYISAVRKYYPKVTKLDGNDLPPPITFDIEARTDLPKSQESYFPNIGVQGPIVKFLKDYYSVYDADSRAGLAPAYHDEAVFSLSVSYNCVSLGKQPSLSAYLDESRNLLKIGGRDTGRKQRLLKMGGHIVPQLCLLPKTLHDPNSFTVDVEHASANMLSFTLQGVFKEVTSKSDRSQIRAFSRTFVTVPSGSSMRITNDLLTITNASPDQIQVAFKNPAPTPSSSPVPEVTPPTATLPTAAGLTDIQQQMVVSFMAESHMNADWSSKCLQENSWDYPKAGQVFLELQKQNRIPQEAFLK